MRPDVIEVEVVPSQFFDFAAVGASPNVRRVPDDPPLFRSKEPVNGLHFEKRTDQTSQNLLTLAAVQKTINALFHCLKVIATEILARLKFLNLERPQRDRKSTRLNSSHL